MASRVPEFSEIVESSLASVATTIALTPRSDLSLSQHTLAHRVTSVLLNRNNFSVWSCSFRLTLGGKGKTGWILGHYPKPATLFLDIHSEILITILFWDDYSTPWRTGFTTCSFIMTLFIVCGLL